MIDLRSWLQGCIKEGSVKLSDLNKINTTEWGLWDLWDDYIAFLQDHPEKENFMAQAVNEILILDRKKKS